MFYVFGVLYHYRTEKKNYTKAFTVYVNLIGIGGKWKPCLCFRTKPQFEKVPFSNSKCCDFN